MIEIRELVLKAQVNQKNSQQPQQSESHQKSLSEAEIQRYINKLSER